MVVKHWLQIKVTSARAPPSSRVSRARLLLRGHWPHIWRFRSTNHLDNPSVLTSHIINTLFNSWFYVIDFHTKKRGGKKKKYGTIGFHGWTRDAAEEIGRSGNAKTKTTSREGMLVSCWANPGWKKGENVESEGEREETIRCQKKVPGFGQKWKGLLEKKSSSHSLLSI